VFGHPSADLVNCLQIHVPPAGFLPLKPAG
jgi:hypothetical protein